MRTDETWKSSDKDQPTAGTPNADFDDSQWKPPKVTGPVGMQPWGDVRAPENRRLPARYAPQGVHRRQAGPPRDRFVSPASASRSCISTARRWATTCSRPASTEYPKRVLYVTHDVTDQIQARRECDRRHPRQRPLLLAAQQGLRRHAALRFPEAAAASAHRARRRHVRRDRQRRVVEADHRRPDHRQQRIRRRGVRRPQGARRLERSRLRRLRVASRPSWSSRAEGDDLAPR